MSYFQAIDNMKVSFEQHQGDAKAELIVKNNMSKSELSNILIINGFPSASFRYVSGKKVLSGETPLINIKDGDKIRVIVSQSKKQIQRNEPHHTPTPSIQPLPNITHENLTSINQQYNQLENQSFFQNDSNIGESKPKLNSISLNHLIDVVIDSLPLHEIYENKKDFINHPKEVYQLGSAINDNKALFGAVYEYLRSQFRAHHQFDPIDEESLLATMGVLIPKNNFALDADLKYQSLNSQQKNDIDLLTHLRNDLSLDIIIAIYFSVDCNILDARAAILSM